MSKQLASFVALFAAFAAAAVLLLLVPKPASAATSDYHPDGDVRSLDAGPAGWTGATSNSGACVPLLLCPQVTNTYNPNGGAGGDGDGFIRTEIASLTGIGGTSSGTWTSRAFRYRGVNGKHPDRVHLNMTRRSDVGELLGVAGNEATFSVDLVAASAGATSVNVVPDRTLAGADDWVAIKRVSIQPGQLQIGERYRIRITSRYVTGATVVPGGSADYDDILLRAKRKGNAGGGGGGTGGGGGGTGPGGGGGPNGGGPNGGGPNAGPLGGSGVSSRGATLRGKRLAVKVRCKRKAGGKCKVKLAPRLNRKGPRIGKAKKVRIRRGKRRVVRLKVKRRYLQQLRSKRRVFVRQKVRANGKTKQRTVRVNLRRR